MTTEETVSAADANRSFARLLRGVRAGRRYVVTSHGTPVARIVPIAPGDADAGRAAAKKALLERLSRQPSVHVDPWTRDELYEDDQ